MKFLLPLDSRVANTQGFVLLDTHSGEHHEFVSDEALPFSRKGFRGGCVVGNVLYVCNSFSVKSYLIEKNDLKYEFNLKWQLQLPEWLMGRAANADLHTLYYDSTRQVLLLANSFMDSVDEISLDGRLLGRQFLWEISDRISKLTITRNPAAPDLCHLNHISQAYGQTLFTLGNLNATGKGAILHRETGEFIIDNLERPHDGIFWKKEFWITETSAYRLRVYSGIEKIEDLKSNNYRVIDLSEYVNKNYKFWCRGIYVTDNSVFLGCSQFQDRRKDAPDMPPSHILEIDKASGEIVRRVDIPGSEELNRPVLFSLIPYEW